MERNSDTNEVLMNLFIIQGQWDEIVGRTCRKFNEVYPNSQKIDKSNIRLPKPVTFDEDINLVIIHGIRFITEE